MCLWSSELVFAGNHDNKWIVTMCVLSADVVCAGNHDNKIVVTMSVLRADLTSPGTLPYTIFLLAEPWKPRGSQAPEPYLTLFFFPRNPRKPDSLHIYCNWTLQRVVPGTRRNPTLQIFFFWDLPAEFRNSSVGTPNCYTVGEKGKESPQQKGIRWSYTLHGINKRQFLSSEHQLLITPDFFYHELRLRLHSSKREAVFFFFKNVFVSSCACF